MATPHRPSQRATNIPRRQAALPLLVVWLLLAGCGLRVDHSTREALLRHELGDQGRSSTQATGDNTGEATGGTTATSVGPIGGATGATSAIGTTGTTGTGTSGGSATTGAPAPAGGNGGSTDVGVTATTVTVGTVVDQSGPRPGVFNGSLAGVRAYFAYVNSRGGVFGRKLQTAAGDSGTSCNQTAAAHNELKGKVLAYVGSFSIYDNCGASFFAANRGIADVSFAISRERGTVKNNFSVQMQAGGAQAGSAIVFKQRYPGIEKHLGALIVDVAGSRSQWSLMKQMYQREGYSVVYEQFVSPTEVDYTRYVIGMRQKGVDMAMVLNDVSGEVKFVNAAQQQNWTPHVITTPAVFYDPAFKDLVQGNPTNVYVQLATGLYLNPEEHAIPGVGLYQDWMRKTAPDQAMDSFSVFGWSQAMLFVQALSKAGPKATRHSLLTALRSIHSLDTGGLMPSGDPALKKPTPCFLIAHWEGSSWRRWQSPARGFDCGKPFLFAS